MTNTDDTDAPSSGTPEPVERRSSRAIVLDEGDRILLLGGRYQERRIWITPGGGNWPGEDDVTTARRELAEETGLQLDTNRFGRVVAFTSGIWTDQHGTRYASTDVFFVVRVQAFTPSRDGHEDLEREWIEEFRWWSLDALEATSETVWPLGLAALVRRLLADAWPTEPVQLDWHH